MGSLLFCMCKHRQLPRLEWDLIVFERAQPRAADELVEASAAASLGVGFDWARAFAASGYCWVWVLLYFKMKTF